MTYIYAADVWCDDCAEKIREEITAAGEAPADPDDERSYDSDEFPKGPYSGNEECDSPQHCAAHEQCINVIEFADGHKIGCWLENDLTTDGIEYVQEAVRDGGQVAELWADWYDWIDFTDPAENELWERCIDLEERADEAARDAKRIESAGSIEYANRLQDEVAAAFADWDARYGDEG